MSDKGVEYRGVKKDDLSPEQAEVLYMLTQEYETPKNISIRRETSLSATYKTINKLRQKGYLSEGYIRGLKKTGTGQSFQPPKRLVKYTPVSSGNHGIRLHGQEFNIKILHKTSFYDELRGKRNFVYEDENPVRIYKDSLEVYSNKDFFGDDEQRATAQSLFYWGKIFSRLEARLKIVFIKGSRSCIKQVNGHYSEVNNELAKDYNKREAKLRVYASEDNRLWFQIDNSLNLNEAETLHPETSKKDMGDVVKPFFNDLRDYPEKPPMLSGIMRVVKEQAEVNRETASGLNAVVTYLKSQLPRKQSEELGSKIRPSYVG